MLRKKSQLLSMNKGGTLSLKQGADIDAPSLVRTLPQPLEEDLGTKP